MTVQADHNGKVTGYFDIPTGIPVGTKSVKFLGEGGSFGEASYTGSGTITVENRRRITDIITLRFDPLAQTFTLPESEIIAGCTVFFKKKGTKETRVQIRTTALGMPTQTVLSEGFLSASDINDKDMATPIDFDPVFLEKDQEYALVLLTDDPDHALAIAELGKYSQNTGWTVKQPYQIGVLLSSSNASTWTAHQDKDLAFSLLACRFKQTTFEVSAGQFAVVDMTDILILADIERTDSDTDIEWILRQTNQPDIYLQARQSVALTEKITGTIDIVARLKGSTNRSPILYSGVQIAIGSLKESALYISRSVSCSNQSNVTINLEQFTPGQSQANVFFEEKGQWKIATFKSSEPIGDGWESRRFVNAISGSESRVKIMLSGQAKDRPLIKNLQMVISDAAG